MNHQSAFRTATLRRPVTEPLPQDIEQARPGGPRRRRSVVVAAIAVAALAAGGVVALTARSDAPGSPEPTPAVTPAQGPNADLPADWTCRRSPLQASCVTPSGGDAGVSLVQGPNADLPADWTCRRSPLHSSCASRTDG